MISILCKCGVSVHEAEDQINKPRKCLSCGAAFMCVSAELLTKGAGAADFDAGLWLRSGPGRAGIAWRLGGCDAIAIGSQPGTHIRLPGQRVVPSHARLSRLDFGPSRWRLESADGPAETFVNNQLIVQHELQHGDIIRIGEFELAYELESARQPSAPEVEAEVELAVAPVEPSRPPAHVRRRETAAIVESEPDGRTCPSCHRPLRSGEKICVSCGIFTDTGRPLLTSQVDENSVYAMTEPIVQVVSFVMPITIFPIPVAADARGKHRPYAIWAIAATTIAVSFVYFIAGFSDDNSMNDLMLWPAGSEQFHPWQLLTNTLIHSRDSVLGFLFHLGGNMLFMLVFGTRVNSLIGNLATVIVYPLLAIASGLAYLASVSPEHALPSLGASGAIFGLAGMYFVLFPAHNVYCAMWLRLTSFTLFRSYFSMKIFAIRGFWVLLIYFGYDVLIASLDFNDGTAHTAHIGGFLTGAVLGFGVLFSRLFDCRNGDILSVVLGKYAWKLTGKPSRWAGTRHEGTKARRHEG